MITVAAAMALPVSVSLTAQPVESPNDAGLVDIQSLVPHISLDMRYAGADNFVGTRIDGYEAHRCFMLRPVAEALARVENDLRAKQQRLHIFDCYRPRRAVAHFMRWARDLSDQSSKQQYYPNLDKSTLVPDYIAEQSGHSRADTVDLTVLQCAADGSDCAALDMGTPFDFFDPSANTDSPAVTPAQRSNRHTLRAAMQAQGFANYELEWWHYSLRAADAPVQSFDLPIRAED
ncbi:MAG: M15 family metallopeptidase [Pseudomarimonas sp.]